MGYQDAFDIPEERTPINQPTLMQTFYAGVLPSGNLQPVQTEKPVMSDWELEEILPIPEGRIA